MPGVSRAGSTLLWLRVLVGELLGVISVVLGTSRVDNILGGRGCGWNLVGYVPGIA